MPRTSVPIAESPEWLAGVNLTAAVGDAANDMDVDLGATPIILLAMNYHTSTVAMSIELPASSLTFGGTKSIPWTLPAATAGIAQPRLTVITNPNVKQSDGKLHIDSADANFAQVRFYAAKWKPTTP